MKTSLTENKNHIVLVNCQIYLHNTRLIKYIFIIKNKTKTKTKKKKKSYSTLSTRTSTCLPTTKCRLARTKKIKLQKDASLAYEKGAKSTCFNRKEENPTPPPPPKKKKAIYDLQPRILIWEKKC